jgi:hemerythrin
MLNMVRAMTWSEAMFCNPSFEVGDAVIDGQHRHIVELINAPAHGR